MKKRGVFCVIFAVALAFTAFSALAGCGGREKIVQDGKTVNVRVYAGGYGTDWLYSLKEKFEAAYAEDGYKINILTPASDLIGTTVINELAQKNSGVDLYFTGNMPVKDGVDGNFGLLVEDITESVMNAKAISFDGSEETTAVKDKLGSGFGDEWTAYNGKYYNFPYASGIGAMVVNTEKLKKYGLEIPKTTDELMHCYEVIFRGNEKMGGSMETGIFPSTFFKGVNGYPTHITNTVAAQLMGYENYLDFWGMVDKDGNERLSDGYLVYEDPALEEVLKLLYRLFDVNYSTFGSTTQEFGMAQAKVMQKNGGAVFMATGDWMLNEVSVEKSYDLNDITLINIPVISALAEKQFGAGTSLGLSRAEADALMRYMIDLVDEGKTDAEIVSAVKENKGKTIAEADAARIREARGVYCNRGVSTANAYIAKDSPVKDIAALFLRMFASDDNSALYLQKANAITPYTDSSVVPDSPYEFVRAAAKIGSYDYAKGIWPKATALREKIGQVEILPVNGLAVAYYITQEGVSKYDEKGNLTGDDGVYDRAANARFLENVAFAAEKWDPWLRAAGLGVN